MGFKLSVTLRVLHSCKVWIRKFLWGSWWMLETMCYLREVIETCVNSVATVAAQVPASSHDIRCLRWCNTLTYGCSVLTLFKHEVLALWNVPLVRYLCVVLSHSANVTIECFDCCCFLLAMELWVQLSNLVRLAENLARQSGSRGCGPPVVLMLLAGEARALELGHDWHGWSVVTYRFGAWTVIAIHIDDLDDSVNSRIDMVLSLMVNCWVRRTTILESPTLSLLTGFGETVVKSPVMELVLPFINRMRVVIAIVNVWDEVTLGLWIAVVSCLEICWVRSDCVEWGFRGLAWSEIESWSLWERGQASMMSVEWSHLDRWIGFLKGYTVGHFKWII